MQYLEKYRRIITGSNYYPEIDGLRFIAILSVILFHILTTIKSVPNSEFNDYWIITKIYQNGWQGVELFFVISGFIIGLPFAKHYLLGTKKIIIKDYLFRRVSRLEPPYFLIIIIFFVIHILIGRYSFFELLPSLLASMVYMHNIIFNNVDYMVIAVIWSLEIEIQFYLLALLFVKVFKLSKSLRRLIMLSVIVGFPVLHQFYYSTPTTIYHFLQFFVLGFLLVDLYLDKEKFEFPKKFTAILGLLSLVTLFFINFQSGLIEHYVYLLSVFLFYYIVLHNDIWRKIMSIRFISIIGGMCYSIYLLHNPIVSAYTQLTHNFQISEYYLLNLLFNSAVLLPTILIISAIYFRFIEKPCMDKNWIKKARNYLFKVKSLAG